MQKWLYCDIRPALPHLICCLFSRTCAAE